MNHKWLIKHLGHLLGKTKFWIEVCLKWVLNWTLAFIKTKWKIRKGLRELNVAQNHKIISKISSNVPSKIDHKNYFLFVFNFSNQFMKT